MKTLATALLITACSLPTLAAETIKEPNLSAAANTPVTGTLLPPDDPLSSGGDLGQPRDQYVSPNPHRYGDPLFDYIESNAAKVRVGVDQLGTALRQQLSKAPAPRDNAPPDTGKPQATWSFPALDRKMLEKQAVKSALKFMLRVIVNER